MKHLVVSPHPDDVELAIGGFIHKLTHQGHVVDLAVVTGKGDLTMVHSGKTIPFEQRMDEQAQAAELLGIRNVHWLDFAPASQFDTQPMSLLVTKFDALFKDYDKIFIPLPSYNIDHKIVWEACLAATRPGRIDHVDIYAYEQPMQEHGMQITNQFGKVYLQIDGPQLEAKAAALLCHKSQMQGREVSLTGLMGLRMLAQWRGLECNARTSLAEMVYLVRAVL